MKEMEKFNNDLNNSNKNSLSSTGYRKQISSILKDAITSLDRRERVCVIGAGKLGDIEVSILSPFFNEVILTDVDVSSIKLGLIQQSITELKNIQLSRIEYSGFEINHFFTDFQKKMISCKTFEDIERTINLMLSNIEKYRFLKSYDKAIDLLIVSPIYTQLVYNQILIECSKLRELGYQEHLLKFIERYMLDQMPSIIDRFNDNLIKSLHEDGILVVLSDIFEVDQKSDFYKKVVAVKDDFHMIEEIYNEYASTYGMGLGDYGLYNLDSKIKSIQSEWLIWPFDEKRGFIVKLTVYKKK